MPSILISHLIAFLLPIIIFLSIKYFKGKKNYDKDKKNFWKRQSKTFLKNTGLLSGTEIVEPFRLLLERQSLQTAIQITSLGIESNLFEEMDKQPGFSVADIAKKLDISQRQAEEAVNILQAGGVLTGAKNGYQLTLTARLYLLKDSPFFTPLPPPVYAKRMLIAAKSGLAKRTVKKWQKGKSTTAEQWVLKQHSYSFPLGFALHQSGLLTGAINIMDMAGGAGSFSIALALNDPKRNITLADLPATIPVAQKLIKKYELSQRIRCIGLDMFSDKWPTNMDAILFTNIFHDWSDEQCLFLANKAYASLRPGGKILIQEALLNENSAGPLWTAHWSLIMAFTMQGRQFRPSELRSIIDNAGFKEMAIRHLLGYFSTISATKPIAT